MSPAPQWHVLGSVPENYERYLVSTIFGPWARELVEVGGPLGVNALDSVPPIDLPRGEGGDAT